MLAIIDYGMGNLRSVQKAFEAKGFQAEVTSDKEKILAADGVILPGVGAFADAMKNLKDTGLDEVIREVVRKKTPLLGICLGLQLLFERSEEKGDTEGLGIFQGEVKLLHTSYKIPHMGWNELVFHKSAPIAEGVPEGTYAYFVHSYHVVPKDRSLIVATCDYGQEIVAIAGKDNVYGIQFHPEKSSDMGLAILENFGKMVEKKC